MTEKQTSPSLDYNNLIKHMINMKENKKTSHNCLSSQNQKTHTFV